MKQLNKVIAFTLVSFLTMACERMFIEQPANNPEAVFENLWTKFYEEYAPFEERNVDWQAAYTNYRPMVNANISDDELFDIISQMLGVLDDGHVSLTAPGRDIFFSNKIRNELIDDELFSIPVVNLTLSRGSKKGKKTVIYMGRLRMRM